MVYIYETCCGELYVEDHELAPKECYCRMCGDSDTLVFCSNDEYEICVFLRSILDVFGLGGFSQEYLEDIYEICITILEEQMLQETE